MVDPKYIGREYPAKGSYEVCAEKFKEYAMAVGDLNPLYMDEEKAKESKYGGLIAPPMFAVVFTRDAFGRPLVDPDLAINLPMLVHGEQEFEFLDVVRPGDMITTTSRIADIYEKKNKDFVVVETISKNQDGKEVVRGKFTFVIRR